jgi:two-component system, OmpR family, response regulator
MFRDARPGVGQYPCSPIADISAVAEFMRKVLVVEDDRETAGQMADCLAEGGYAVDLAVDGNDALERGRSGDYAVITVDRLLPGLDGLEVVQRLRTTGVTTPALIISALGEVDDRVRGLRAGGDDYLVKPFAFAELVARLAAVCRRAGDRPAAVVKAGELSLDLTNRRAYRNDQEIEKALTPTEFSLLEMLLRHAGQVVTRKMLCEHLWETDWEGTTNVIEVHINRLRKKLDRDGAGSFIQTVRGRGYALRAT